MRSLFVAVHQPRIASHVCGQYRGQLTLKPGGSVLHHHTKSLRWILYDKSRLLTILNPKAAGACSRFRGALTVERDEAWLEDHRYLNMDLLKEHKKEALRQAA